MHEMAKKVWQKVEAHRTVQVFNPYSPMYEDILAECGEEEARYRCWKADHLPNILAAPRTYLDMVVTTPDGNRRILIKIVESLKFDIWWDDFTRNKIFQPEADACLGGLSYKQLLEYCDRDNPSDYLFRLSRAGGNDSNELNELYGSYKRGTWYHYHTRDIVKSFSNIVSHMESYDNDNGMSFKDCLNVRNAKRTSIKNGRIFGKVKKQRFAG